MSRPSDLLSQAGGILRDAAEPGWDAIAARVIAVVRETPRPGGWPLVADGADLPGPGHLYVSENVVRATLAVTLRQLYLCAPTAIEFDIDGGAVRAVHLEITGSYGAELHELGDRIRTTTAAVIAELLGPSTTTSKPINVTITDVVNGDPLRY